MYIYTTIIHYIYIYICVYLYLLDSLGWYNQQKNTGNLGKNVSKRWKKEKNKTSTWNVFPTSNTLGFNINLTSKTGNTTNKKCSKNSLEATKIEALSSNGPHWVPGLKIRCDLRRSPKCRRHSAAAKAPPTEIQWRFSYDVKMKLVY